MSASARNLWRKGNAWFICDVCGERHRRSVMRTRWDGLKVDALCDDPRPPQMTPPDVWAEGLPFPDARPPQDEPDVLTDDQAVNAQDSFAWQGAAGDASNPWHVVRTLQAPAGASNRQGPGAVSPRTVLEAPLAPPTANTVEDQLTIKTGPVFAGTITTTFGGE